VGLLSSVSFKILSRLEKRLLTIPFNLPLSTAWPVIKKEKGGKGKFGRPRMLRFRGEARADRFYLFQFSLN